MNRPSDRTLLWLAAGLVAVSVGLAAGPLPWRFAGESGLPTPSPAAPPSGRPAAVSLAPIIALSPFGRLAEAPVPEPQVEQETALGLVLLGVVIATDPKASTRDPRRRHRRLAGLCRRRRGGAGRDAGGGLRRSRRADGRRQPRDTVLPGQRPRQLHPAATGAQT